MGAQALAPDGEDALDIGLRAGPDLEAGIARLEVHRQRRAQIVEAGMHSPQIERQWARAMRSVGKSPASGYFSLRYSAMAQVSQILAPRR